MSFNVLDVTLVQKSNINIASPAAGGNDELGLADSNELTTPAFASATCGEDNAVMTVAEDNCAASEGSAAITGTGGAAEAVSEADAAGEVDAAPATAKRAKPKARRAGKRSVAKSKGGEQKRERAEKYLLDVANWEKPCRLMSAELELSLPFIRKVRGELVTAGLVPTEALGPRRPGIRKVAPQVAHDTVADCATSALSQSMTDAKEVVRVDCERANSEPAPDTQSCGARGSLRSVRITTLVVGAIGAAAFIANRLLGAAFRN